MKLWSGDAQAQRRLELAAFIRQKFRPLLDDRAQSKKLVWWDQERVAIWAANAFFLGEPADVAFANTILRYVRDAEDCPSFAAFKTEMKQARIIDQLYGGRRRVHDGRPDLRLSTHYCPYTQTTMYDAVNGLTHEIPQFAYSDGRHWDLPLLDGKPAPGFEDWEWIETQIERPVETYNPID